MAPMPSLEPLPRTLEPEVMDTEDEARDYDAMDHVEVNARFVGDLLAFRPRVGEVLDVGTGTARIPIALCTRVPSATVVAIDLADHMLTLARKNVANAKLEGRITLEKRDAKSAGWPDGRFEVVLSNTILHHIPDPTDLVREMWRLTAKGGTIFLRDLARPSSAAEVRALVAKHGGTAASSDARAVEAHARQVALFEASLHAALTLDEIRARVSALGIPGSAVTMTSDRHWTLAHTKS
jgi:ubiquinone/menaquinone biosynthesis C-methylase UbiE